MRNGLFRAGLIRLTRWRVEEKVREVSRYLPKQGRILDIGAGNCVVCSLLRRQKLQVIPLDIRESSFVDGLPMVLYNGRNMPFRDGTFDLALLLTVLHHTRDPISVLEEARRVAKSLIVIEEVYDNRIHKLLTFFIDSVFNLEFLGHPHTNRTDKEWERTFRQLGFEIKDARYMRSLLVLKRATYFLNCQSSASKGLPNLIDHLRTDMSQ